jgi:hypothetical protein
MPIPDPVKSPQQQLVEALNLMHRTRLTTGKVKFGTITMVDPTVLDITNPLTRNTKVEITNADDEPYEFATVLHFNRLSLEALFVGRETTFDGAVTHSHDLLPLLSGRLGFPVTADDIVGHEIEESVGYPKSLLLVAAETSLLLFGQVNVTLTGP